ncbi:unnamed protein product [Polarella glacialis]|uniref:Uncharacterized protein n=1 Tax=Polarella glacialis TaxID=89957 RepID=A0A813HMV0_POLGL|nr:unnamed protein product [Polarella glacialis]
MPDPELVRCRATPSNTAVTMRIKTLKIQGPTSTVIENAVCVIIAKLINTDDWHPFAPSWPASHSKLALRWWALLVGAQNECLLFCSRYFCPHCPLPEVQKKKRRRQLGNFYVFVIRCLWLLSCFVVDCGAV